MPYQTAAGDMDSDLAVYMDRNHCPYKVCKYHFRICPAENVYGRPFGDEQSNRRFTVSIAADDFRSPAEILCDHRLCCSNICRNSGRPSDQDSLRTEENTGERFSLNEDAEGIAADEFERLIMKYIPVSQEIIRENTAFNKENGEYYWTGLGCMNYAPTCFGTSVPEVVDIKENDDETTTLTVNAVCEMVMNDEAIITHELTIKEDADGSFKYMGNKILDDGINRIPDYQYRIRVSDD